MLLYVLLPCDGMVYEYVPIEVLSDTRIHPVS